MSHSKFMRATLFATAILVPLVAGLSPVLAQDREDHAVRSAASQHEAMAAARDLLDVNGEMKRLEAQFPAMADAAQRAIKESPVIAKAKIDVRQMTLNLLSKHKDELKGEIAKVYSAIFTVEELKGFTAFFRGPTGARFQLFATTLAANHDSDRRKAAAETAASIGFTPVEKAQLGTYFKTADWQKLLRCEPVIAASVGNILQQLGVMIGIEIKQAALARTRQSALSGGA